MFYRHVQCNTLFIYQGSPSIFSRGTYFVAQPKIVKISCAFINNAIVFIIGT